MRHAIFFNSSCAIVQVPGPSGHTNTQRLFKIFVLNKECDEALSEETSNIKVGQAHTLFMTTLYLSSVIMFWYYWHLKTFMLYNNLLSPRSKRDFLILKACLFSLQHSFSLSFIYLFLFLVMYSWKVAQKYFNP